MKTIQDAVIDALTRLDPIAENWPYSLEYIAQVVVSAYKVHELAELADMSPTQLYDAFNHVRSRLEHLRPRTPQ